MVDLLGVVVYSHRRTFDLRAKGNGVMDVVWTDYLKYRAELRGFDLAGIEEILKSSKEHYIDTATDRRIAVGQCGKTLVLVP